jgi:hypothetical protein
LTFSMPWLMILTPTAIVMKVLMEIMIYLNDYQVNHHVPSFRCWIVWSFDRLFVCLFVSASELLSRLDGRWINLTRHHICFMRCMMFIEKETLKHWNIETLEHWNIVVNIVGYWWMNVQTAQHKCVTNPKQNNWMSPD